MSITSVGSNVTTATTTVSKTSANRSSGSADRDVAIGDVVETRATDSASAKLTQATANGQEIPEVTVDVQGKGSSSDSSYLNVQVQSTTSDDGDSGGDDDADDNNATTTIDRRA